MLGALPTMQEANQRIQTLQSSPYNLQAFATKTGQAYISPASSGQEAYAESTNTKFVNPNAYYYAEPVDPNKKGGGVQEMSDTMAIIKKYAPYAIGAIVLYYLILKNK